MPEISKKCKYFINSHHEGLVKVIKVNRQPNLMEFISVSLVKYKNFRTKPSKSFILIVFNVNLNSFSRILYVFQPHP